MPKKKKSPAATVSTPAEADEVAVVEAVDAEPEVVASTSTSMSTSEDRELQETPVPKSKAAGKRTSEKAELQNRLLDLFERDVQASRNMSLVDDDDPVDLQLMSMAKCIKTELPSNERFTILIKLQQVLHESIEAVNRKKFIDATLLAPDAQTFFQVGTPVVTIQQQPQQQQQQQPAVHPPPPMLQQQPQAIQQQQMYQQPDNAAMPQLQLGQNLYRETYQIRGYVGNYGKETSSSWYIFRWFKFTLKPPYSGAHERSLLAIWDTSHWNFLSNLVSGQLETSLMTSYCHF